MDKKKNRLDELGRRQLLSKVKDVQVSIVKLTGAVDDMGRVCKSLGWNHERIVLQGFRLMLEERAKIIKETTDYLIKNNNSEVKK